MSRKKRSSNQLKTKDTRKPVSYGGLLHTLDIMLMIVCTSAFTGMHVHIQAIRRRRWITVTRVHIIWSLFSQADDDV